MKEEGKRARGRPRAYDPEAALARATGTFWRAGYSGTTLDDLSAATGMNRPSLYGAFGDKRDLYLAALDRYVERSCVDMAEALDEKLPLTTGLQRVYNRALALYFTDTEAPLGCFLVGTAATEAARDSDVRFKLGSGLRELTRRFEARLRLAQVNGEIAADTDAAVLADLAGAVLHSIALRSRAGDSRTSLQRFSREAVKFLCTGGPQKRSRKRKRSHA